MSEKEPQFLNNEGKDADELKREKDAARELQETLEKEGIKVEDPEQKRQRDEAADEVLMGSALQNAHVEDDDRKAT